MGRPRGAKAIDWEGIIDQLRSDAGRWMLLPEMRRVPISTENVIRGRRRPALRRIKDGRILVRRTVTLTLEDGSRVATLILKFQPKEEHHASQE